MEIVMVVTVSHASGPYRRGRIYTLPAELAAEWLKVGHCKRVLERGKADEAKPPAVNSEAVAPPADGRTKKR